MKQVERFREFMKRVIKNIEEIGSNHITQYDLEMKVFDQTHNIIEKPDDESDK
jgi:hypothetical protein